MCLVVSCQLKCYFPCNSISMKKHLVQCVLNNVLAVFFFVNLVQARQANSNGNCDGFVMVIVMVS